MRQLRWFVAVVLLLGALGSLVFFVFNNRQEVAVELPFLAKFYGPTWLVLFGAFFAGAFAASAGLLFQLGRKTLAARRFEKRVASLESELGKLRQLPAAAPPASEGR